MKKNEGKVVGILGTVIIHLIAAILFMSFKIRSLNTDSSDKFLVEFAPVAKEDLQEKMIELPTTSIEKILQGDEELLNIARNLANKPTEKIDPSDYVDKVKEELIKSGKLGTENFIDEQKRTKEKNGDEKLAMQNEVSQGNEEANTEESRKMAANYQGPTRIYYNLIGRTHTYLPIPIYKCPGSGKIMLAITVNQQGEVSGTSIVPSESTTNDPCLIETAVKYAMISRFNADINSPREQAGTITYQFVAQ